MLRVLDLFSGIGGFSLGLERTGGFRTVAFCELDYYCRCVLARHWPDVPCHDDVTTRQFQPGEADVICGGFPCQDLSNAGKRAGLAGERSGLYRELVRAIRVVRPLHAIVENVAALLGSGMGTVLGDLAEIGYDTEWDCVPACALGAPHERDRVWIVAHADRGWRWPGIAARDDDHRHDAGWAKKNGVLGKVSESNNQGRLESNSSNADGEGRLQPGGAFAEFRRRLHHGTPAFDGWATPWPEALSQIQGMDDGLSDRLDKAGIDALGNTVLPQIPELIGRAILEAQTARNEAA